MLEFPKNRRICRSKNQFQNAFYPAFLSRHSQDRVPRELLHLLLLGTQTRLPVLLRDRPPRGIRLFRGTLTTLYSSLTRKRSKPVPSRGLPGLLRRGHAPGHAPAALLQRGHRAPAPAPVLRGDALPDPLAGAQVPAVDLPPGAEGRQGVLREAEEPQGRKQGTGDDLGSGEVERGERVS